MYRKRQHRSEGGVDLEQSEDPLFLLPNSPMRFTYEELMTATDNFDMERRLGRGGFGSVFEGMLSDGTKITVKRLDRIGQGRREFVAEVRIIGSIHHVKLVKLVGFCAEDVHRLLVYEYMSKGSLDKWIFHNNPETDLGWDTKKKIILLVARGLAYLHVSCHKRIAHLDVKPQNVLLDDEFNARLSDFGLATLIDRDESFVMTQMRGTPGYLAPEWLGGRITEKADVYSYGIVVLEVIFNRKNLIYSPTEEDANLLTNMVIQKVEAEQLSDLLDICSNDMQQNSREVEQMMKLALWCMHTDAARRPTMSTVVKILEDALTVELIGGYFYTSPIIIQKSEPKD